jgi:hypothetical protein
MHKKGTRNLPEGSVVYWHPGGGYIFRSDTRTVPLAGKYRVYKFDPEDGLWATHNARCVWKKNLIFIQTVHFFRY